jgi:hypothetical protein
MKKLELASRWQFVDKHDALQAGLSKEELHVCDPERLQRDAREMKIEDTWIESPLGKDWVVAYRILAQGGAPVVGEVRIFPTETKRRHPGQWSAEFLGARASAPPGGLTSRLLRRVRLGANLKEAGKIIKWWYESHPEAIAPLTERGLVAAPRRPTGRGRKGHPDLFYALLADEYVAAVQARSPRPAVDVARRRRLKAARVRDLLHEARHRGLLTVQRHGVKGGVLTNAARTLLDGARAARRSR